MCVFSVGLWCVYVLMCVMWVCAKGVQGLWSVRVVCVFVRVCLCACLCVDVRYVGVCVCWGVSMCACGSARVRVYGCVNVFVC